MKEIIAARIKSFREVMRRMDISALYISGTDPHRSEYLCDHWQTRRFATGFTGSYGEVVITKDHAGLWTDTRYFLQAEEELDGTEIMLHKLRVPRAVPVTEWLFARLKEGDRVGMDPFSLPLEIYRQLSVKLSEKNIDLVSLPGILDEVWTDRPPLPAEPVFDLPLPYSGESHPGKYKRICEILKQKGCGLTMITALDDLAWTYNLRGSDIAYNPVFYGFAIVGENTDILITHPDTIPEELKKELVLQGVRLENYTELQEILASFSGHCFYMDPASMNTGLWNAIACHNRIMEGASIPGALKAVKNPAELQGLRETMVKDGIAMTQFLWWLKNNVTEGMLTEYAAGRKVAEFRWQNEGFMGESFPPIVGYGAHGAVVHLSVNEFNTGMIRPEGVLLIDSGGHYLSGTTDITRTVAVGPVSDRQKKDFTLVLKGMIALSMAVFPEGTRGMHLDILARGPLCREGLNYGHGTGHGVGHFLCVHEGPASIRMEYNPEEIKAGMVFTNEPGMYRKDEYGIRTENMMVVTEKQSTEFGRFLGFETLTLCPVDTSLLDTGLLSSEEISWLNGYHLMVREKISPFLSGEVAEFLKKTTAEI